MSEVTVKPVASRRERKLFLELPWSLYRDDPLWIPPLRHNQKELVGFAKHPFYEMNECQTFLAWREGRPVGRVAAILNHGHNEFYKEKLGFFGFFESVQDVQVANGLMDAARGWFEQHGIHAIRGPANPSLNYEVGLLVDGFDSSPMFMMTYNPPYYGDLIEQSGFSKCQDLYAFTGHSKSIATREKKLDFIINEVKSRFDLKLRRVDKKRFREEVRGFLKIYNKSLAGTWGFVPLSDGEIEHLSKSLRALLVPELTSVGEIDGEVIGFVIGLLNYNPRIKQIDGRLLPFGFLRLLMNRRAIKEARFLSANVSPEYQRWGLGLALLDRVAPDVLEWGIGNAEFSWVLESNKLSAGTLQRGGARIYKTYRMYDSCP